MKFAFILLLYLVIGVNCYTSGDYRKKDSEIQSHDGYPKSTPPTRKFWTEDIHYKIREQKPYRRQQVYEDRGPALFPQQEQPFPPGGPSVLAPPGGSQSFKVGSSLNFGGNRPGGNAGYGLFSSGIQPSSGSFGSRPLGNGNFQSTNTFQGGSNENLENFPQETSSGFQGGPGGNVGSFPQGTAVGESFEVPIGNIGGSENFQDFNGQPAIGGAISSQPFNRYPGEGFGVYPTKYESTLAKNPLFLVLKLLITEPGLWVTSPVLYHGLAHTGIVKPFPHGFGIYGYRFSNNVPDSQTYGNSNILQDKP